MSGNVSLFLHETVTSHHLIPDTPLGAWVLSQAGTNTELKETATYRV
jgi:hypothetical protein